MAVFAKYRKTALKATAQLVKTAGTVVYGYYISNEDAGADTYLHFYDAATAAAVTVGTTVPDLTYRLPAGAVLEESPISTLNSEGITFALGLVLAATTTEGGLTAPTTGLTVNLFYV